VTTATGPFAKDCGCEVFTTAHWLDLIARVAG
jgi:hypothetical protein